MPPLIWRVFQTINERLKQGAAINGVNPMKAIHLAMLLNALVLIGWAGFIVYSSHTFQRQFSPCGMTWETGEAMDEEACAYFDFDKSDSKKAWGE
jgi:hypothetical protein